MAREAFANIVAGEANDEHVIDRLALAILGGEREIFNTRQLAAIPLGSAAAACIQLIEHLELLAADSGLNFVEAQIESNFLVQVFILAAVVSQHRHLASNFIIPSGDRAAVAIDGQVLGGIKAECGVLGKTPEALAAPFGSMRLGTIFNHPK